MALEIGNSAVDFKLKGVDGKEYALASFADRKALAIVFSCNHCPYVEAYEDRMIQIHKQFEPKGFTLVAINSNEDKNYPQDSFENMVIRAKDKGFPFPYLRDETQRVARAYGAVRTPHVFLLDEKRNLRYQGAIDDNWEHPDKLKKPYLIWAIEALLAGKLPPQAETLPVGCSIKWRANEKK